MMLADRDAIVQARGKHGEAAWKEAEMKLADKRLAERKLKGGGWKEEAERRLTERRRLRGGWLRPPQPQPQPQLLVPWH